MATIVWCIEAPKGNFLKEVIIYVSGVRLLFSNSWDDKPLIFATEEQAIKFRKENGLIWLNITEHMIMN